MASPALGPKVSPVQRVLNAVLLGYRPAKQAGGIVGAFGAAARKNLSRIHNSGGGLELTSDCILPHIGALRRVKRGR